MDLVTEGTLRVGDRTHLSVADVKVYETQDIREVRDVVNKEHLLVRVESAVKARVIWAGQRIAKTEWEPGDLCFQPARADITCHMDGPFSDSVIRLQDKHFIEAAKDHIDFSLLNLHFAHLNDSALNHMTGAMLHMAKGGVFDHWPLLVESTMMALVVMLVKLISPQANTAFRDTTYSLSDQRKKRTLDYMGDNFGRQISLAELADNVALSKFHFNRLFAAKMGQTPLRYLAEKRVGAAKVKLRSTTDPIAQIALDCGFASQSHMTTVFKEVMGITPAAYRKVGR